VAATSGRSDAADDAITTPSVQTSIVSREATTDDVGRPAADVLSGRWLFTNEIDQSSTPSFVHLTLGFQLQLVQDGMHVRGHGLKTTENGHAVTQRAQTPIVVVGTVKENRLTLAFMEQGTRRTSTGDFQLDVAKDGSLQGRFSTDAAMSAGHTRAVRQ